MTRESLEHRLQRLPGGWGVGRLGDLPAVQFIGYGITRPGAHTEDGVPMIRAADIQEGRLRGDEPRRIDHRVHETNLRSRLEIGDLLVVLVGRVGETAVVGAEFHHWNASRTVAVVRANEPDEAAWLNLWLGSPAVRAWCERQATGSTLHRTLSLTALRKLPVPIPPAGLRAPLLRAVRLLEEKTATNTRIARCAMDLGEAHFAREPRDGTSWPERPLASLVHLTAGTAPRPRPDDEGAHAERGTAFVAPADILQSESPHLYATERRLPPGKEGRVCAPGSLLVASREDGVRTVMNQVPAAIGRNVLALETESVSDAYWLLYELCSRSAELAATAQGSAGRELNRRAFAATTVRWPPQEVREQFVRLAGSLHERARTARRENEKLRDLRERILDGFLSGTFPGKTADPLEDLTSGGAR
ncbi:hypothetical protein OIE73_11045 [Streptomyces hirsutus]|uniref:Restriction endonuclease subunit S n=1 Tax=Streptomyces hirsutus TaxID=35620 RepID=A0ABZ1GLE5_9ACTN|nr:hypothetical protein [Streptomyces hirsutus]WSD06258.1 hypothetical protein OIE73_11045 [Streptomyces hirsutus]